MAHSTFQQRFSLKFISGKVAGRFRSALPGKGLASWQAILLVGVAILICVGGGIFWYWHSQQYEHTDNATLQGHVHPVAARVAGTVTQVLVGDNERVQSGQILAILDDRDYRLALSQAEHELLNAKARAKTALSQIAYTQKQSSSQRTQAQGSLEASQSVIAQSQGQVQEAQEAVAQAKALLAEENAALQRAESDYQRYQKVDPAAVSMQQREVIATQLQAARAARDAAVSALAQAKARAAQAVSQVQGNRSRLVQSQGVLQSANAQSLQVQVSQAQYQAALADVKLAEDRVRQARLNLSYTRISAPANGKVGKKTVEVGQRIQPAEALMAVVGEDVWVVANYKETQLKQMQPGQPVDVEVDAFPHHHFKGTVDSFSPASGASFALLPPENATGNFTKIVQRVPVKIRLSPDSVKGYQSRLVPGLSAVVSVHVGYRPKASTDTDKSSVH